MPAHPPELPPPMNHVFVDFENVQQIDFAVIGDKSVSFMLLVGAKQTSLGLDIVEKLMTHAATVQLVRLTSSGKNALDFAVAYYVGRAAASDPGGYFHIVSRDTGFDPLVEHLRSRHIRARRHGDFSSLSFSAPPMAPAAKSVAAPAPEKPLASAKKPAKTPADPVSRALAHLKKKGKSAPKDFKALIHDLQNVLKPASEASVRKVIAKLEQNQQIALGADDSVKYQFH